MLQRFNYAAIFLVGTLQLTAYTRWPCSTEWAPPHCPRHAGRFSENIKTKQPDGHSEKEEDVVLGVEPQRKQSRLASTILNEARSRRSNTAERKTRQKSEFASNNATMFLEGIPSFARDKQMARGG